MKRGGLGRGLDVLLPQSGELLETVVRDISIDEIDPNASQPRRDFDKEALEQLADSIREAGVLSPILVVENGMRYRIVAGERRYRAARLAGLETVPCIVRSMTNEQRFWETFTALSGRERKSAEGTFLQFYLNDFEKLSGLAGGKGEAAQLVRRIRRKGMKTVLATNPLFPRIATEARIRWAGMAAEDFDWITTYENSRFCKPSPDYYREVLAAVGAHPQNCLMIGNDTEEDMCTADLGMQVYLVTDHLIDGKGLGAEAFRHGSLAQLENQLDELLES